MMLGIKHLFFLVLLNIVLIGPSEQQPSRQQACNVLCWNRGMGRGGAGRRVAARNLMGRGRVPKGSPYVDEFSALSWPMGGYGEELYKPHLTGRGVSWPIYRPLMKPSPKPSPKAGASPATQAPAAAEPAES